MSHKKAKRIGLLTLALLLVAVGGLALSTYVLYQRQKFDRPLLEAVRKGDIAGVKSLVTRGADVNAHESRAPSSPMQSLLEFYRRVRGEDTHTPSALAIAARERHFDIVRLLLDRGADVGSR